MKNIIYLKTYNAHQDVKLISLDEKTSIPNVWVPGNNSLENFGKLESANNYFINIGDHGVRAPRPDLIVNCIADCDVFSNRLKVLNEDIEKIGDCKIINHPRYILKTSRDEISRNLQNIDNLITPKTIRLVAGNKADFISNLKKEFSDKSEILIRKVATHMGESLIKVDLHAKNLSEQLDPISFNNQECYATEFYDFKSADSLYRKIRIIMINGKPHIRHQIISESWNIHSNSRQGMVNNENLKKEEELFMQNSLENLREVFDEIYRKVKLDIFGIDCALIDNKKLLIFEVNASMEFINQDTSKFRYLEHHIRGIKKSFLSMLEEKLG